MSHGRIGFCVACSAGGTMTLDDHWRKHFHTLLSPFWLRPESALVYAALLSWFTADVRNSWSSPVLDYCPQDGLLSAHVAGFDIDPVLDVYGFRPSGDELSRKWSPSSCFPSAPVMPTRSSRFFDFGLVLSNRPEVGAEEVKVHHKLLSTQDSRFPLADGVLGTIWAMQFYWTAHQQLTLCEFSRTLRDKGIVYLLAPQLQSVAWSVENWGKVPLPTRRRLGGRQAHLKSSARVAASWKDLFSQTGFRVVREYPVLQREIFWLYEVGFRWGDEALIAWRKSLLEMPRDDFLHHKKRYVSGIYSSLANWIDLVLPHARDHSHCFYVLQKK